MTMPRTTEVLIVGAGIGGLTTALSLHQAGIDALVVERVSQIRPLGVGINLQPAAVGELAGLGLGDRLADIAVAPTEHVYADQHGRRAFADPRGLAAGHPWPQYSVHRGELQMMLLHAVRERLGPDAIRTGLPLRSLHETDDAIRAELGDDPVTITAGAVIGADGLHSTTRRLLHPDEGPPRWSGVQMWRGTTAARPFLTGRSMVIASSDRGAQFVAYPLSEPSPSSGEVLINWVCLVPTGQPGPLTAGVSWTREGRLADVARYYRDWDLGWLDLHGLIAGSAEILEYPMVDRDPLEWWGRGRVTLLGDAAHPVYPTGANGGSQAIIDGRALARELAATSADPAIGLASYEQARRPATSRLVQASREMDRNGRVAPRASAVAAITDRYRQVADHASTP